MLEQCIYNDMQEKRSDVKLIGSELSQRPALRLSADNPIHRNYAAYLLKNGKIGAIAFNGIYGLFASADNEPAHGRILKIKNRPSDKHGVLVVPPERLREHADISKTNYTYGQITKLQKHLHALGIILPASEGAPEHLVHKKGEDRTILTIWTEYHPLRMLIEEFQKLGGRALAGTSANRSGQLTHFDTEAVWQDFKLDVCFILEADYSRFPKERRKSTSIIDLTGDDPVLHRVGNVSQEEIDAGLKKFGFPSLQLQPVKRALTFEELRQEWYVAAHARYLQRLIDNLNKFKHPMPQG